MTPERKAEFREHLALYMRDECITELFDALDEAERDRKWLSFLLNKSVIRLRIKGSWRNIRTTQDIDVAMKEDV